jgi:PIN domain nuclease of toxin-antitoxin system
MNLLLDTATFLWYVSADRRLPAPTRNLIMGAEHDVWLSVVSIWEIVVKAQMDRLHLPGPAWEYVTTQRERHAIASLALEEGALANLAKLPSFHRDPFDRMLVCQALHQDLTLVTQDASIERYPVKTAWMV